MRNVFDSILFEFVLSRDIINGYWIKLRAINAVMYLTTFFDWEKNFEKSLTSQRSTIPAKTRPCEVLTLIYFKTQNSSSNLWT